MAQDITYARLLAPFTFAPFMLIALAGCAPDDAGSDGSGESAASEVTNDAAVGDETGGEGSSDGDGEGSSGNAPSSPILVASTGWLTVGADGSVLTTFLDADGRYRDFRNGVSADTGTWERRPNGKLCLKPDEAKGACWTSERPSADGSMIITNDDGKQVELKPITYTAPPEDGAD